MLIPNISHLLKPKRSQVSRLDKTTSFTYFGANNAAECCFYVRPQSISTNKANGYYRAVYLSERTAHDLKLEVASKCQFEASKVARVVRVCGDIEVILYDDDVKEIREGQDMIVEFAEIHDEAMSPTSAECLEMRLIF